MTMSWAPRVVTLLLAGFFGPGARADQIHYTYTVAAGGASPAITIPIADSPVVISCVQTVRGDVGTGEVTLIRSTGNGGLIYNGYDGKGQITNAQGGQNPHIVYCDFYAVVDLQEVTGAQIKVFNKDAVSRTVVIMLTY